METVTISIENGMEKYQAEGTDGNGKPIASSLEAKMDGTDAPVTGNPNGDMISIKRADTHHLTAHLKKDGKETVTVHSVVSKDGKTRTQTITGKAPDGTAVNQTLVYDKQM